MQKDLDIEKEAELLDYLRATDRIGPRERVQVKVLAGGVSNRTVWVKRESGESWVLKQALAKLRVKVDWFSDPRRIEREAMGLRWLATLAPEGTITPLVFEDREKHLLAMEAVPEPHENWKSMLLRGEVDLQHVQQFAFILARIHRTSAQRADELKPEFEDRSFFESLRLEPYYLYAAKQDPRAGTFLHSLVDETRQTREALVHGDYSPKNVLIREGKLVLLDHEVIHWGDPAFDLGFALTHFLSKAHHLVEHRRKFVKAAVSFWANYDHGVGDDAVVEKMQDRVVRHTLACMLARVLGRSPLEYLDAEERTRQRDLVVRMMDEKIEDVPSLVASFFVRLEDHGSR
jgi:aminoglycoside phosphotransferase (APT) family kinase protein